MRRLISGISIKILILLFLVAPAGAALPGPVMPSRFARNRRRLASDTTWVSVSTTDIWIHLIKSRKGESERKEVA